MSFYCGGRYEEAISLRASEYNGLTSGQKSRQTHRERKNRCGYATSIDLAEDFR